VGKACCANETTTEDRLGMNRVFDPRVELPICIAAGVLLLIAFVLGRLGLANLGAAASWLSLAIGLVYGGRAAWEALRERHFDIDVLMVLAAVLAAGMGHPEDGALLLFLFTLSGALEDRAMQRTRRAVEALHGLMPTAAMVWNDDQGAAGAWTEVDPAELKAGDRARIRTGELVPADARISAGNTSIDQATLTGESVPREVGPGDEIYAGTLNVGNPIEAVVERPAAESSLQRVLNLVISAQQQRQPIQRAIDRMSQPYAIGVVVVSAAVFLIWWRVFGDPLLAEGQRGAIHTAIALLIVGSPCALVIATPTATLAAISRAARAGLLFKGGQAIERLSRLSAVCLDKTGTLTLGRPRLRQVHAVGWSDGAEMLAIAAALESGSTHPVAVAVADAAASRGVTAPHPSLLEDIPGQGLRGVVEGREARLGRYDHCEPLIPVCLRARVQEMHDKIRARGQIAVVVAAAGASPTADEGPDAGQAAVLILSDSIRPGARELVSRLHDLNVRPVVMLTGDSRVTAGQVAGELGIDRWEAELLPQDKVRAVESLRAGGHGGVGVIGDGVNDAPALAAADVSVAIGSIGSDAALESADIVLLNDDLTVVPWAVRLARRARATIVFNITLALVIIAGMGAAVLIGSRIGRDVPLPIAVIAHEGGTLLVVLNSLRLLAIRGPARVAPVSEPDDDRPAPQRAEAGAGVV
jgi:Cd2+/Zn2+-exporting ATPase